MAAKALPSQEALRQLLNYEPATGKLYWKSRDQSMFEGDTRLTAQNKCNAWNVRNAGREAFTASDGKGYRQGQICKYHTTAHRVIWAYVHGEWPDCIDHINGNGCDNRLINLRKVSRQENAMNRCQSSRGRMGVRFNKGIWEAYIGVDRKIKYLGSFPSEDAALQARRKAERELGFHANHGRPHHGQARVRGPRMTAA